MFAFNLYWRQRRAEKTPLGLVVSVLSEVNHNQKVMNNFTTNRKTRKLKTASWRRNRVRADFLPYELKSSLDQASEMAGDVNNRIDTARKRNSDSYMIGVNVEAVKVPLARSQEQLKEWLMENASKPEYAPRRRGLFG